MPKNFISLFGSAGEVVPAVGFLPSALPNLAVWYRRGIGQTTSQWNDQSGNSRHMTMTGTPTISSGCYTFNGTTQWGHVTFTIAQPCTVFIRFKSLAWAGNLNVMGGNAVDTFRLVYQTPSPAIALYNGGDVITEPTSIDATGTNFDSVIAESINGALLSLIQIDGNTTITGTNSINDPGGFTIGAEADNSNPSNIQVMEFGAYSDAKNLGDRGSLFTYLASL